MNNQNVHGNTITGQGRGLDGESSGFIFNGNTVNVAEGTGNTEYGGCELDGTYGIRVKNYDWPNSTESGTSASTNFQITNNTITVPATHCPSTALDLTDMNSLVLEHLGEYLLAPAGSGGLANALGFEAIDAAKITFSTNQFTAPTCVLIGGDGDIPYGSYTASRSNLELCSRADGSCSGRYVWAVGRHCTADHYQRYNFESHGVLHGLLHRCRQHWKWIHTHLRFERTIKRQTAAGILTAIQRLEAVLRCAIRFDHDLRPASMAGFIFPDLF